MKLDIVIKENLGYKDYMEKYYSSGFFGYLRESKAKIRCGSRVIRSTSKLIKGDVLSIEYTPIVQTGKISTKPLEIAYEDENIIVVNKPFGLATEPSYAHPNDSVYNRLLHRFQNTENTVHFISRLDKDTKGLLLVAKNQFTACLLNNMHDRIIKLYCAETYLSLPYNHGFIETPIGRIDGNRRGIKYEGGHPSKTEYLYIGKYGHYHRYSLRLYTGRTHQIRVHMSSEGCALVNDPLYGYTMVDGPMHLQAYFLKFINPINNKLIEVATEINF